MKQHIFFLFAGFLSLKSSAHLNNCDSTGNTGYMLSCTSQIQPILPSDSLQKYVGQYLLSGETITVYLKENILRAVLPNQPEFELAFVKEYEFTVKGAPGFIVRFETDTHKDITGFTLIQPDGMVKANKVSGVVNIASATPVQLTKEQLDKNTGDYLLPGNTLQVKRNDTILVAKIPGQQDYELVPVSESHFTVKGLSGFSLQFQKDNKGNVIKCIISQPGGNVISIRVRK
ncbi:MAG: hypothetical protein JNJ86_16905 [Chitinophagaceae bacterium]|nr:hypothetical protein [Chitinophagaceae bacterium]